MMKLDEREEKILGKNSTIILALLLLFVTAVATYKVLTTKTFDNITIEMSVIMIIGVSYVLLNIKSTRFWFPVDFKEEQLKPTKKSKQSRINSYLIEAFGLASGFSILECIAYYVFGIKDMLLSDGILSHINGVILVTFFSCLVVFFILNYIVGEIIVRCYQKKLEK